MKDTVNTEAFKRAMERTEKRRNVMTNAFIKISKESSKEHNEHLKAMIDRGMFSYRATEPLKIRPNGYLLTWGDILLAIAFASAMTLIFLPHMFL